MRILNKNDQNGRSMVEMLGVLAIIGVLSVGGISGYSKAMAKYKLTRAQDQIVMLLMNIRTAFATSPNYNGLSDSVAANYNLAPSEMVQLVSGTEYSLYSTFGGKVHVGACASGYSAHATANGSGTSGNYFYITMTDLGKEACRSLGASDWGADGLMRVLVGSTAKTPTQLPFSVSEAGDACGSELNSITWVYY